MKNIIETFKACTSATQVLDQMTGFYRAHGFRSVVRAVPSPREPGQMEITELGTPSEWLRLQRELGITGPNPIPRFALESGEIFMWDQIGELTRLSEQERAFIAQMRRISPGYGLIMPTFGNVVRAAITGISNPAIGLTIGADQHIVLHSIAQQAHIRLDQIAQEDQPRPALSPRETQILFWIANGKSNNDVATILGLSSDTVCTYVKRLFHKLGVNDRTSASIVGVQTGLITIDHSPERQAA